MAYTITLVALCALYLVCIYCMKYIRNIKIGNLCFTLCVFLLYAIGAIIIYSGVGFYDWNFQNTLPTANVSPFMFCALLIILFLPKQIRTHCHLLIALLSVGMLFSALFGCAHNIIIRYKFHPQFLMDYLAHVTLSLFGVYLVRSEQVELSKKNALISGAIIFGVATIMLLLNIIFDTAFFGLSLNGKHNIYNMVLVQNSYLSALIYCAGLAIVLVLGYFYSTAIKKFLKPIH